MSGILWRGEQHLGAPHAGWRIFISPVDTLKTALQVNGREALALLTARMRSGGFMELYAGGAR
jgi:hypothetical protein